MRLTVAVTAQFGRFLVGVALAAETLDLGDDRLAKGMKRTRHKRQAARTGLAAYPSAWSRTTPRGQTPIGR